MNKRALISVSDKSQLEELAKALLEYNYNIISTGGSAKALQAAGIPVTEVASITQLPEMLSGRVKTLHPKILGGVLARRDSEEHLRQLAEHQIPEFDIIVVNLYPFTETISHPECSEESAIENIDIGGPTMIRAAAKNHEFVTVVTSPAQYADLITELKQHSGATSLALRKRLAREAFAHTASYDAVITNYFDSIASDSSLQAKNSSSLRAEGEAIHSPKTLAENLPPAMKHKQSLRYGENPHQRAALYTDPLARGTGVANAEQLHGKELSFNNLLDLDAAWRIVSEYSSDIPCVSIVKHNNPCGVAIAPNVALAYTEALSCDPLSAFGGIVAANTIIDEAAALEMKDIFLEAIIAPDFTIAAREILYEKKNLRLLRCATLKQNQGYDIKKISGGYLIQDTDELLLDRDELETVTKKQIEEHQWVDLLFAWKVVKHCKSNAIVTVLAGKTIGIGVGQTSRVKAVEDALRNCDLDTRGAVMASDAFFPFADNIALAAQNHIAAIIQPGGSIRDEEVIAACDEAGIAMVFTKCRHFRH